MQLDAMKDGASEKKGVVVDNHSKTDSMQKMHSCPPAHALRTEGSKAGALPLLVPCKLLGSMQVC
jgi:hypothetical protein